MNIVIPMAGLGSRFKIEGFDTPKPLIQVAGKTLVEHSIDSLNINGRYIFITRKYENKKVGVFNGEKSFVEISPNRKLVECLNKNHTLSILVNSEQQVDKVPIWLIGDKNKKFIEYT